MRITKLNLGCSRVEGQYKRDWINLDLIKHDGISVIGSGIELPFKDNSVNVIHCIHVLEHVKRNLYLKMMKESYRVLKPGGSFCIEVPNFLETISSLLKAYKQENHLKVHIWTTSIYGKNEREGMAHYWGFTPYLLLAKLKEAGFKNIFSLKEDAISSHYKQEPVLVYEAIK